MFKLFMFPHLNGGTWLFKNWSMQRMIWNKEDQQSTSSHNFLSLHFCRILKRSGDDWYISGLHLHSFRSFQGHHPNQKSQTGQELFVAVRVTWAFAIFHGTFKEFGCWEPTVDCHLVAISVTTYDVFPDVSTVFFGRWDECHFNQAWWKGLSIYNQVRWCLKICGMTWNVILGVCNYPSLL